MNSLLEGFPVVIDIKVAWGEMDAFQHVNNIIYYRYFETARIAYLDKLGMMETIEKTGQGPILASSHCSFKFPLTYPDTISVGAKVSKLEEDRITMEYRIVSHRHRRIAAEGGATGVFYDFRIKKKAMLPQEVVEKIKVLEKM